MANDTRKNVMDESHYQTLVDGIAASDEAAKQIALAKQAGLDVAQWEEANAETRSKLLRLKNTYFPGR